MPVLLPPAGALLLAATVPPPLLLPALSLLFLAGALLIVAARPEREGDPRSASAPEAQDFAGLLAFFGFCAALLSEPEQVLPFLRSGNGR